MRHCLEKPGIIIYTAFYLCLAVLYITYAVRVFTGETFHVYVSFVDLYLLAAAAIFILGYTIWKPSWRKLLAFCIAFLSVGCGYFTLHHAEAYAAKHFLLPRQAALEKLVADLTAYGSIRHMSNRGHYRYLNEEQFEYPIDGTYSSRLPGFEQILAKEGVDAETYEDFLHRMESLGFIYLEMKQNYVGFMIDGFLDNTYGLLYLREGQSVPMKGSQVFWDQLVGLEHIMGPWYYFNTS